jgi:hypothetical protein
MVSSRQILYHPILAVESLQVTDVESMFSLTRTYDTDWVGFRTAFELPHDSSESVMEYIGIRC